MSHIISVLKIIYNKSILSVCLKTSHNKKKNVIYIQRGAEVIVQDLDEFVVIEIMIKFIVSDI